jgi:hypothetical protein
VEQLQSCLGPSLLWTNEKKFQMRFNMIMVWKMRWTGGCRHWVQSTHSHPTYIKLVLTLSSH